MEYTLDEAIKAIREDNTKVFKCGGYTLECLDGVMVRCSCGLGLVNFQMCLNNKWTPVRQAITWQEGLKRYANGEYVSVKAKDIWNHYGKIREYILYDWLSISTCAIKHLINNGEWYKA